MSFRSSAYRDGALVTEGPSRVTNEIIRPTPAVMVLDFEYSGRHRAVVTHDCLLFAPHVGHVIVRNAGKCGRQEWQTGNTMTIGPGDGPDMESVGTTHILAAFITAEMVGFVTHLLETPCMLTLTAPLRCPSERPADPICLMRTSR